MNNRPPAVADRLLLAQTRIVQPAFVEILAGTIFSRAPGEDRNRVNDRPQLAVRKLSLRAERFIFGRTQNLRESSGNVPLSYAAA